MAQEPLVSAIFSVTADLPLTVGDLMSPQTGMLQLPGQPPLEVKVGDVIAIKNGVLVKNPELPEAVDLDKKPEKPKVYHTSNKDDWGTPWPFFKALDDEFHLDLDVCAGPSGPPSLYEHNSKCPLYFSLDEGTNGLEQSWFGKVFMNPPYTSVDKWIVKLITEIQGHNCELAVALVAARTDTAWFQAAASWAGEIRFLRGRLTFEGAKSPAPFPSAVLIFDRRDKQSICFWDWKTGAKIAYRYQGFGIAPKGGVLTVSKLVDKLLAQQVAKSGLQKPTFGPWSIETKK